MSFVSDYGQFGRACRNCDDPNECDNLGYCPLDLPSGHSDDPELAPLDGGTPEHPSASAPRERKQ